MGRIMMFFGLALAQIAAGCADAPDSPLGAVADDLVEVRRLLGAGHRFHGCREVLDLIERADAKARTTPVK